MPRTRIVATLVAALTLTVGLALAPGSVAAAAPAKDPVIIVPGFTTGPGPRDRLRARCATGSRTPATTSP